MTRRGPRWEDKTPTEPVRLKSGTTLNLLDLATSATRLARAYDRAAQHAGTDPSSHAEIGAELIALGRDLAALGYAIVREGRKKR